MKSIGERIKDARKSAGLTQLELAKKTDLSRSYIGDIEKDRYNPSVSTLQLIATATNTPLENLLPSSKTPSSTGRGIRIPVLGRVVAGIPLEAVEEILDYEEITPELAATGEFFALKIRGHSMEPRMMEGDVVIVRRQADVIQKSGVHSQWNGRRFLILYWHDKGNVRRFQAVALSH
jgi:repressor LexA